MQSPRQSDRPEPGYYLLRLVRGGSWVPAQITHSEVEGWRVMINGAWEGPAHDPWSLPNMERVHWGGRVTTAEDVAFRLARKAHAEIYAPDDAAANPTKKIDLDKLIPF